MWTTLLTSSRAPRLSTPRNMVRKLAARLQSPRRARAPRSPGPIGPPCSWQDFEIELPDDDALFCGRCDGKRQQQELDGASCGHLFCKPCLRVHISGHDFIASPVPCPKVGCDWTLSPELVRNLVGPEAYRRSQLKVDEEAAKNMQRELDKEEAKALHERRHFRCPLCLEEVAKRDAVELNCGHWHCQDCLRAFLTSKITEAQVSEHDLACPIPGCGQEMSEVQIQSITAQTSIWDRFLEFRARNWQPRGNEGMIASCPSPDCERFEVLPDTKSTRCPRCRRTFCVKCGGEPHDGTSCEDYQVLKRERDAGDRAFEDLLKKEEWRRCPKCGMPSQRESGCNFMRCLSSACKRQRVCWCYVCGAQLSQLEHLTHFPSGPFRNRCYGTPDK